MTPTLAVRRGVTPITVGEAIDVAPRMLAAGWSIAGLQSYFARRGLKRGWRTVYRWAHPELAESDRAETRARMRLQVASASSGRLGRRDQSDEWKIVRLLALREQARLSVASVAKVMAFDFGDHLTEDQVRYALKTGLYPRHVNREMEGGSR